MAKILLEKENAGETPGDNFTCSLQVNSAGGTLTKLIYSLNILDIGGRVRLVEY